MTTFSYQVKTPVDFQVMAVGMPFTLSSDAGFTSQSQAESAYGSPFFTEQLPVAIPHGSVLETVDTISLAKRLYPLGTDYYIWNPNWQPNDAEQYYGRYFADYSPNQPAAYYTSFRFTTPLGEPVYFSGMERQSRDVIVFSRERYYLTSVSLSDPDKPNYYSLLKGYELDTRKVPNQPVIVPTINQKITLVYYRQNKLEPIGFPSLDWMSYELNLVAGEPIVLPIVDCVLGTMYCSSASVKSQISNLQTLSEKYDYSNYFPTDIGALFSQWNALWQSQLVSISIPATALNYATVKETSRSVVTIGAINNYWNNRSNPTNDFNASSSHPLVTVNNLRAYNWHIKPQSDGSIGNLIMDSPRTIEIHAALNAGKWAINPDDPTKPRKDDLGWRIERMNEVLGIRVGTDLKFNPTKEKSMVRRVIKSDQKLDPKKVGVNNFGSDGMVVKRINNQFNGDKIESDQCVIVYDILQLIQEYHEQHNLAVGIQESSAIQIKEGKNRARFDNQLGLLVEMFNLLTSANEMTRASLISSLVSQSQTNEIIAGLGRRLAHQSRHFRQ